MDAVGMDESMAVTALADAVRSRRAELGLTHDAVLAAGGPSGVTLTKIESASGPVPRPSTLKKLDKALDWRPGSSARVLRGAVPTPVSFPSEEHQVEFVANTLSLADGVRKGAHIGYLELAMKVADFIEDPPSLEIRQELASHWRDVTTNAVIQYLIQLDPKNDAPELAARASKLLTPERQAQAENVRDGLWSAAEFIERARSSSRTEGGPDTVTSLADRRPVPPPPALDELDVAASRREKQSDTERPEAERQGTETKASRSGVSRVRRNVPDLTVDEFLPGGVDPTSPGDKQADHG